MGYLRRTAAALSEMLRRLVSALRSAFGWPENRNPAADLTDDLIVEILSRLPVKSVCRFKCVSKHWLDGLITHPHYRAKIPQTLTGFFRSIQNDSDSDADDEDNYNHDVVGDGYESGDEDPSVPDFLSIVGEKAHQVVSSSLSFLPSGLYRSVVPRHCSNGLLLCLCWKVSPTNEADYVVCNPATQQWVTVPGNGHRDRSRMPLYLVASSSGHFHLFAVLQSLYGYIAGVDIYSSETGAWTSHKETGWANEAKEYDLQNEHSVFFHGMLHLVTMNRAIVAVDTEGSTWKTIPLLEAMLPVYLSRLNVAFIGESQGRMHYVNNSRENYYALSVWTLEGDDRWIPKHRVSTHALFGTKFPDMDNLSFVAIHPERNTIFFTVSDDKKLVSYDMDRRKGHVCGALNCGTDGEEDNPYLPYVPSWRSIP